MHGPDVCLKIALLGEAFAATIAAVVLHAGVDLYVRVHVAFLSETLATHLLSASVPVRRNSTHAHYYWTYMTSVGLVTGVDHHMSLQVACNRRY